MLQFYSYLVKPPLALAVRAQVNTIGVLVAPHLGMELDVFDGCFPYVFESDGCKLEFVLERVQKHECVIQTVVK